MDQEKLSMALFSGTDDKLMAAGVLTVGAVAMGKSVDILLQDWALDSFRADRITKDHGLSPEAGEEGAAAFRDHVQKSGHWSEMFRQAKELGDLQIHACALAMDMLGLTRDDLDPLVDDVEGVASFVGDATGQITFI